MAVTYGFYNSLEGDRKYNAIQMSSIFDGIVIDGILMAIGERFIVRATTGMGITVGSGRAWFDHTWTYNDSILYLNVAESEIVLDRIDALVIEVDTREASRTNSIRWVHGQPASIPTRPTLEKGMFVNQYPLAYIEVAHGVTSISQANITNMVGTEETPFATGPLETINASFLLDQWKDAWDIQITQQQVDFEHMQNVWGAWIGGAISDPGTFFQRNFDNPAMYVGSTRWMTRVGGRVIKEEIRGGTLQTGPLAASRTTTTRVNGADIEYIFYNLIDETIVSHFIERFDRVNATTVKNYMEMV